MITLRPSRDFGSFRLDHFQSLQHFGPESCGGHPMQWGDMIMWNHETISPRAALPQPRRRPRRVSAPRSGPT